MTVTNVADWLSDHARRAPDAVAVDGNGGAVRYATLDGLVWRAATILCHEGVRPGTIVGISFTRELSGLIALLALARIGATAVALPVAESLRQREDVARAAGVSVTIFDDERSRLASVPGFVLHVARAASLERVDRAGYVSAPVAPWLIVHGSGSTGSPKLIPVPHSMVVANASRVLRSQPMRPGDRVSALAAFDYYSAKLLYSYALSSGATLVLELSRGDWLAGCRKHGVTILSAAVVHLEQALSRAAMSTTTSLPLDGVRMLITGGSIVTASLRERVTSRLCPNLFVMYSTNEFGRIALARPDELLAAPGTVGRPIDGVQVQIVDANGRVLPRGQTGLIRVRAEGMISGYVANVEASARAFREGWFLPGDVGQLTSEGFLIYRGRADRMMIVDGINVHAEEIEAVMNMHPEVVDSVAMPLSSEIHQAIPVCVVSLRSSAALPEGALLEYARERLGTRAPRSVFVLSAIPRSATGKVSRDALLEIVRARIAGAS